MTHPTRNAAMLWTGGKDSALALHEAVRAGWNIRGLVTFVPERPAFLAHPLAVMRLQARALGLAHHLVTIAPPFEAGYERALDGLRNSLQIDSVITGDIAEVNAQPNWISERCARVGLHACLPLWQRDRESLLRDLNHIGIRALISCVDTRWLDAHWVGRELDAVAIAELHAVRKRNGLDPCGENGEYHTLVIDGPLFSRPIELGRREIRREGALAVMQVHEAALGNAPIVPAGIYVPPVGV